MAAQLRREGGRNAIHGRLLDSPLRHPGGVWLRDISRECPAYQEPAGTEERCAGKPVVAETSHPRTIEQLVSTPIRYSCAENLLPAAGGACNRDGNVYSTHAKSIDTDEHPISQRNQRPEWQNRAGHHSSHSAWRTRSAETGRTQRLGIHATKEEIAKSLQGNWRPELLFIVRQQLEMYEAYQRRIAECDQQLREHLANFASAPTSVDTCNPPQSKKSKRYRYMPQFPLSNELMRISGVDLTQIDGVDAMTAQTLISEVGLDMSRWKTESHFAFWLGLCPDNRISGDKVLSRGTRRVINRAATALRIAASTLIRSKTYLGAQYRRLRTKLGAPKAITAMAHRLARLVYRMLKYGQGYVDKGADYYEQKSRQQQIEFVRKKAAQLGFQVTLPQA
jgi:transposase